MIETILDICYRCGCFSTFLVNYMGFAIKNNSAISLGLIEASQRIMGKSRSAGQCKHNGLGNMGYQGLLGVQMVRYVPFDNGIDKGKVCGLVGLNLECIEDHARCSLAWTLNEINFEIHRQSLPNRSSETREFYICTNMYPFNRVRDKLGIVYT